MTKSEKKCRDMTDVCELAHERTKRDIAKLNKRLNLKGIHRHSVNCLGLMDCKDEGQDHSEDGVGTHYGAKAQDIFNDHYDHICEVTGI